MRTTATDAILADIDRAILRGRLAQARLARALRENQRRP